MHDRHVILYISKGTEILCPSTVCHILIVRILHAMLFDIPSERSISGKYRKPIFSMFVHSNFDVKLCQTSVF